MLTYWSDASISLPICRLNAVIKVSLANRPLSTAIFFAMARSYLGWGVRASSGRGQYHALRLYVFGAEDGADLGGRRTLESDAWRVGILPPPRRRPAVRP